MSEQDPPSKLWGGRFREATDQFVQRFTASVAFDQRMALHDIAGSLAHADMLAQIGVLSADELQAIRDGLTQVRAEIESGEFNWSIELEDLHMNIEARLTQLVGAAGRKLHTGRSRNDQVATALRLYLRDAIDSMAAELTRLQSAIVELAGGHTDTIMPGFTHLQNAQPISFGHHLLAWNEMLERDHGRLQDCRRRLNQSPLGAAALAGTSYPIDRAQTAAALGFSEPTGNSLDSVSDRDFVIELCSFGALLLTHLSRIAEELVLWNSPRFNFVELPDRFCTGSSIMPQKKNPDVPELVRGKTGRVVGHLMSVLTLMKSQPLAYNRDNQEDKEPVFDTVDTVLDCLRACADLVPAIVPNRAVMREAATAGYATATDLADYLVRLGVPFRDAHQVVGKVVAHGLETGTELAQMDLATLQGWCAEIREDVFAVLTPEGSVAARNHLGGTAPEQVRAAVKRAGERLAAR